MKGRRNEKDKTRNKEAVRHFSDYGLRILKPEETENVKNGGNSGGVTSQPGYKEVYNEKENTEFFNGVRNNL